MISKKTRSQCNHLWQGMGLPQSEFDKIVHDYDRDSFASFCVSVTIVGGCMLWWQYDQHAWAIVWWTVFTVLSLVVNLPAYRRSSGESC